MNELWLGSTRDVDAALAAAAIKLACEALPLDESRIEFEEGVGVATELPLSNVLIGFLKNILPDLEGVVALDGGGGGAIGWLGVVAGFLLVVAVDDFCPKMENDLILSSGDWDTGFTDASRFCASG